MKIFLILFASILMAAPVFAYDGDMDVYHEFKEELSLVRDGYEGNLNMAMETASEKSGGALEGWFALRSKGGAKTWAQLDFVPPTLKYLTITEMPYGFRLKGSHGAYKINVDVRVVTRDSDIFYDVKFKKGSNGPGKEIFGEVFHNDRVVFYNEKTPCKRKSVTCIGEYTLGTPGK